MKNASSLLKASLLVIVSSLLFTQTLLASESAVIIDNSCADADNLKDPHYIPYKVSKASESLAGNCVDTDKYRHTTILSQDDKQITFTNFRHENKYYTASIPKKDIVSSALFQVVRFPIITGVEAAHVQIRLKMNKSFLLVDQITKEESLQQDLILSYEAVQAKDGSYNFAKGAFNNYPFVGRLLSGKQKSIEYPEITITEQYELKLNQKQLDQLLIDGIKDSENFKMDSFYNTVDFNCATKAFALLDNLPDLLVKEPESFLTVLSNDPVAGPSIKALKDRNLLVRRVSNLRDELEKGEYKELEMPKSPSLGLLTELEDKEYSVVFFSETENMVENQTDLIKNAEKEAYTILPMLMQAIISASMDTQEDTLATLNSALKTVKSKIGHSINYLDNMAGESPVNVTMFFVPWDKFMGGEKINPLSHLDVKAALPFDSYKIQSRSDLFLASLNMYEIQEHLRNNPSEKRPFAPLGFNVSLHLEKGKTTITLQNVTHIQELQKEFSFSNPQVNFNQIVVPKGEALDPALFLTLKQTVSQKPRLLFEFAGFEGIYGDNPEFRFDLENLGQFYKSRSFASSLHNRPGSCKVQAAYTPRLVGKFGPKAHENGIINYILKDRGVEFQIFAIEMDLENDFQIKNSNINVSVESLGFRCITQEDVNTQFTDAGNQQLLDLKKHFQVDTEGTQPLIKMLGHFLKGNTENVVSGF